MGATRRLEVVTLRRAPYPSLSAPGRAVALVPGGLQPLAGPLHRLSCLAALVVSGCNGRFGEPSWESVFTMFCETKMESPE